MAKQTNVETIDYPELYVPIELAGYYPDALDQAKQSSNILKPGWLADIEGVTKRGVVAAVAGAKHNGIVPGSIAAPARPLRKTAQPAILNGKTSTLILELRRDDTPTEEDRQADALYAYSEEHRDEFEAEVGDLVAAILADPERAYQLRVHTDALAIATSAQRADARAAEAELRRLAREECPICKASDSARIGAIETRSLLPGQRVSWPESVRATIRSCIPCWHVASTIHLEELAAEQVTEGDTRSDLVARNLATGA